MSFARGFNSGYGAVLDGVRLAQQQKESERIKLRDEKKLALEDQEAKGFYQNELGEVVDKNQAFIKNEDGTESLLSGMKFRPGRLRQQAALTESAEYQNTPEMRALVKANTQSILNSRDTNTEAQKLMNVKGRTTQEGVLLYGFYNDFSAITEDPETYNNLTDVERDVLYQTLAAEAQGIEEITGDNPLDVFLDSNVPGYKVANKIQNMIQKDPSSLERIDLNDYAGGLNSLFGMQTKRFKGKAFEGGGVKGIVEDVSIDFSSYKLDADNNTLILKANYKVKNEDGEVVTINGTLNDTDREIIKSDLDASDEVAFSMNDLIDYTASGAAMFSYIGDPKLKEVVKAGKNASYKKAVMFPSADYGEINKIEAQAESLFLKQQSQVESKFNKAGVNDSYAEFFTSGNVGDENLVVSDIISNFPDKDLYLDQVTDDENYPTGYKLKRDENGDPFPLWKLKTKSMKSTEEIRKELSSGNPNMFINQTNKVVYTFNNLDTDLDNTMSLSEVKTIINEMNPSTYQLIEEWLESSGTPITTENVLPLLKQLDAAGDL